MGRANACDINSGRAIMILADHIDWILSGYLGPEKGVNVYSKFDLSDQAKSIKVPRWQISQWTKVSASVANLPRLRDA